ncbi:type II CAAX prenyl endopeptidase Rce1 family protein [Comamonas sp. GB3 AK4-5]|uniref:CPBP family glutamic-type intramembrane protease n=1 Tax=Comamonas sp. GB3 AK4-5 TaxID=3231487 RepID=UPI00351E58ED
MWQNIIQYSKNLRLNNYSIINIKKIHPIALVILAYFAMKLAFASAFFFYEQLGVDANGVMQFRESDKKHPWVAGFFVVLLAPWLETLIHQHAIKRLFIWWKITNSSIYIFISAILFGIAHGSKLAFLPAFMAGVVLATVYQLRDHPPGRPFFYTWMVHFMNNGIAFFIWKTTSN